jgi:hypothetical protein
MSDFKPMSECKGFNMKRLLVKNKNGYMFTGYYEDGMIRADGNEEERSRPFEFDAFILLEDLANEVNSENSNCAIFDVMFLCPFCKSKNTQVIHAISYCDCDDCGKSFEA